MGHPAHHAAAPETPAPASLLAALFVCHDADGPVCHLFDATAPDGLPSPLVAYARLDNFTDKRVRCATSILTHTAPCRAVLAGRSLRLGVRAQF